jgi:hypothetical protein
MFKIVTLFNLSNREAWHKVISGSGGIVTRLFNVAQEGGEWSASLPGRSTPGELALQTHRTEGWVACLDVL